MRRIRLSSDTSHIGAKFNRLTVVGEAGFAGTNLVVIAVCECGTVTRPQLSAVKRGDVKSCGCLRRELNKTHGETGTPLYKIWRSMIRRCVDPKTPRFEDYGGRGISVCAVWRDDFVAFRDWAVSAGWEPGLQIDRENNDGDYEPDNCRFVTISRNCRNRRSNRLITVFGETKCISDWADDPRCSVSAMVITTRMWRGWSEVDAVTQPAAYRGQV